MNKKLDPQESQIAKHAEKRFGMPRLVELAKRLQPRDLSGRLARMLKGK
jgi:hypothetical protein